MLMRYLGPVLFLALTVFALFSMYKYVPEMVKPGGLIANLINSVIFSR